MNLFKKTIITFCAITIVSLLTSCTTNVEQPSSSEDGLSILTISINKTPRAAFSEQPSYTSVLPDSYTREQLSNFLYVLTGNKSDNELESVTPKINLNDKKTIFTYEEIISGCTKKALDPIKWDLVLTAYQKKDNEVDFTKPVLIGNIKNVDLSFGSMIVKFNMETYIPHLEPGIDDQATGLFTYKLFFNDDLLTNKVEGFTIDILNPSTSKSVLKNSIVIKRDEFTIQGTNGTAESKQPIEVKGGEYLLTIKALPSNLDFNYTFATIIQNGNTTPFNWYHKGVIENIKLQ